jgi:hypothetical protein
MKQIILTTYLVFFSGFAIGQIQNSKAILEKSISDYSSRTIKVLNKNDTNFKFKVENKNIFYDDLDNDGDFDAVVEIFFCEESNCHPTTSWSELIVYLRNNDNYSYVASKGFSLFGKINSIKNGKIYIDVYGLDEDDPQCCPQIKNKEIYKLSKEKLVKVKE